MLENVFYRSKHEWEGKYVFVLAIFIAQSINLFSSSICPVEYRISFHNNLPSSHRKIAGFSLYDNNKIPQFVII